MHVSENRQMNNVSTNRLGPNIIDISIDFLQTSENLKTFTYRFSIKAYIQTSRKCFLSTLPIKHVSGCVIIIDCENIHKVGRF